jgi:chromodomain-helicase-DNA-binding protein 7
MELRKCCNHPFLVKDMGRQLTDNKPTPYVEKLRIESSGKMVLLDKLLQVLSK